MIKAGQGRAGEHQGPARRQGDDVRGHARQASGDSYQVGISIGPYGERKPVSFGTAAKEAFVYPYYASVVILAGLYDMIRGKVPGRLQGPIGITKQIAKAANRGALSTSCRC